VNCNALESKHADTNTKRSTELASIIIIIVTSNTKKETAPNEDEHNAMIPIETNDPHRNTEIDVMDLVKSGEFTLTEVLTERYALFT